jgi:hypothetical protein
VRHGPGYLHHNFVVALLNDLFGIQARGGCSCAGPYGHRLLGIDLTRSQAYEREVVRGSEGVRPGWVRVNFNYFIGEDSFRYIVEAVKLIARDGWLLLPDYTFCPRSGLWHHRRGRPDPALRLTDLSYRRGRLEYRTRQVTEPVWALDGYLSEARRIFDEARARLSVADLPMFGVGLLMSFLSAWLCVRWLLRYIASHNFVVFAWYRIAFGLVVLATAWGGWIDWRG